MNVLAVCDHLGYEGISTHSFRKWYTTEIYRAKGHDIVLVQRLLQHSTAATTYRYIGIEIQRMEQTISGAYTFDVKKKERDYTRSFFLLLIK
jgi:integrase